MELPIPLDTHPGMEPLDPAVIAAPPATEILQAELGLDPSCPWYGKLIAVYACHGKYYRTWFHVHLPGQAASLANRMTDPQEIRPDADAHGGWTAHDTGFGLKAFWLYTPTASLSGDDLILRRLMISLKQYSTRNGLCRKLRKTDAAYLALHGRG